MAGGNVNYKIQVDAVGTNAVLRMEKQMQALKKSMSETAAATTGINEKFSKIGDILAKSAGAVALVGAISKLKTAFEEAASSAEKLYDKALLAGQSVQGLAALQLGLKDVGLSAEQSEKLVDKFLEGMKKGVEDAEKGWGAVFEKMGVSIKNADGTMKAATPTLAAFADEWKKLPEGMAKAQLAQEMFGDNWRAMSAALNQGGDAIKAAAEKSAEAGAAMANLTPVITALKQEWENMTGGALQSVSVYQSLHAVLITVREVFHAVLEPIDNMLESLGYTKNKSEEASAGVRILVDALAVMGGAIAAAIGIVADLIAIFGRLASAAIAAAQVVGNAFAAISKAATLDFSGAKQSMEDVRRAANESGKALKEAWNFQVTDPAQKFNQVAGAIRAAAVPARQVTDEFGAMGGASQKAAREMLRAFKGAEESGKKAGGATKDMTDKLEKLYKQAMKFVVGEDPFAKYTESLRQFTSLQEKLKGTRFEINTEQAQQALSNLRDKFLQAFGVQNPTAEYERAMAALKQGLDAGVISAEQFANAADKVREKWWAATAKEGGIMGSIAQIRDAVINLGDSFADALIDSINGGKDAWKNFANNALKQMARILISSAWKDLMKGLMGGLGTGGGGIFSSIFGSIFGSANGNVFRNGMPIQAFANGGIVGSPTLFPMRSGIGLMGEAGPEAIVPLTRRNGKLGIEAQAPQIQINNYSGSEINTRQQDNRTIIEITKKEIMADIARGGGMISSAMQNAYRLSRV